MATYRSVSADGFVADVLRRHQAVLLVVFVSGAGPVELLLWLLLAVVAGVLTKVLVARRRRAES